MMAGVPASSMHDVVEVDVLVRVHKEDVAATDHIGHRVAYQVTTDNQDTRRLRSPDELVRREEHGVDRMCRIPFAATSMSMGLRRHSPRRPGARGHAVSL